MPDDRQDQPEPDDHRELFEAERYEAEYDEERLAFAGEHTNMAMFGYMEGALQSGFLAAVRIQEAAGVAPAPPGA